MGAHCLALALKVNSSEKAAGLSDSTHYRVVLNKILPGLLEFPARFLVKKKFFFKFIYFERESRGGAERKGGRIPSRLRAASTEPHAGLHPTNRKIMS